MLETSSPLALGLGETALRLSLATFVGALMGLDREIRGHSAGLRTHGVVSLSSAVITISALMLFEQLRTEEAQPDPLRVVQGLAQAIGFIAAGLIFVKGGDVRNLTSAANIWLATAIGIACGAGQYGLVLIASALGFFLLVGLRYVDQWLERRGADRYGPGTAAACGTEDGPTTRSGKGRKTKSEPTCPADGDDSDDKTRQ
jgi:putative Mg2+ transporter-C (MgtC) family protein